MTKPFRIPIVILAGGQSPEHDVSLASADHMRSLLHDFCSHVAIVCISKDGKWHLKDHPPDHRYARQIILDCASQMLNRQATANDLCVFPVTHGPMGEDGCLQGWLKHEGFPYIGCDVCASAVSMDKAISKRICNSLHIPTVPWIEISHHRWTHQRQDSLDHLHHTIPSPHHRSPCSPRWLIKPNRLGSSLGVSAAGNQQELIEAIHEALKWDRTILVEEFISHRTEIELAVIVDHPHHCHISDPCEVWSKDEIYNYEQKYNSNESTIKVANNLTSTQTDQMKKHIRTLVETCKISGFCRMDWIYSRQRNMLYLSEINTIPGLGIRSHFIELWRQSQKDLPTLLLDLLHASVSHK